MPAQRVPGPLGLETDPFPGPDGPWERWPVRAVLQVGTAADALHGATPVGLVSPELMEPEAPEAAEDIKPVERFRYMEIQTEVVKVRCVPLWQGRMLGLLGDCDEDEKAQDKLVRSINNFKPKTRTNMVSFLLDQLHTNNKSNSPVAGRLASIKVGKDGEEAGRSANGVTGALPAVQRGRKVADG